LTLSELCARHRYTHAGREVVLDEFGNYIVEPSFIETSFMRPKVMRPVFSTAHGL
jgi:hypothetical protein